MATVIDEARRLKSEAMDARDGGNFERAVSLIERAEDELRAALAELKANRAGGDGPGPFEAEVAGQLVHILGSKGGILRRWGKYEESAKAYDAGYLEFERPEAGYGVVNSYNLVQRLVSRVFTEPACAGDDGLKVSGLVVRDALLDAMREIRRQLEGKRAGDEYAAADLALVSLLLGEPDWESTLDDFINSSPPPQPYAVEATLKLFQELHDRLAESPSAPADLLRRVESAMDELAFAAGG
jgi:tetratricopeptide (TPR) repeat protein